MFKSPKVRLALRALLSGALAAGAVVYASNGNVDKTVLLAAAAAGIHAFAEIFTPLNALVGPFKDTPEAKVVIGELLNKLGGPTAAQAISKDDVIAAAKAVAK